MAGGKTTAPQDSECIDAANNNATVPVSGPKYGMKFNTAAITPHNNGFGRPTKNIAKPIATTKPQLISVIINRYEEMVRSALRAISTIPSRRNSAPSFTDNASPVASKKYNSTNVTTALTMNPFAHTRSDPVQPGRFTCTVGVPSAWPSVIRSTCS